MATQLYVIEFPHGKRYFGITSRTLAARWQGHKDLTARSRRPLYAALRKYPEAIIRTLVVGERSYILALEIAAIQQFQTRDPRHGYNVSRGGDINPMVGAKHTAEALAKISEASAARVRSAATREKTRASLKGHKISAETRAKISAAVKAAMTPEVRAKVSAATLGRKLSEEAKAKMRGRVLSLEHRRNIAEGVKKARRSMSAAPQIN